MFEEIEGMKDAWSSISISELVYSKRENRPFEVVTTLHKGRLSVNKVLITTMEISDLSLLQSN